LEGHDAVVKLNGCVPEAGQHEEGEPHKGSIWEGRVVG
jgi:hypothetical protein